MKYMIKFLILHSSFFIFSYFCIKNSIMLWERRKPAATGCEKSIWNAQ